MGGVRYRRARMLQFSLFNFTITLFFPGHSLEQYAPIRLRDSGKSKILQLLLKDPAYKSCLEKTVKLYQLPKEDVENCSRNVHDILKKHADGNYMFDYELYVYDSEHSITEVAAIECVFWTLKAVGTFYIPLTIHAK